jgi:hypothetical protein
MRQLTIIGLALAALLLAGCGDYWADQGQASRTAAEARRLQAEAQRQSAQAQIIDAQARGSLAESQAKALTTTINANADLTRQAISLADNSEYIWLFAGIAVFGLAIGGLGVYLAGRRQVMVVPSAPEPPVVMRPALKPGITIESIAGPVRIEQQDGETRYHYMLRVRQVAEAIQAAEDRWLLDGPSEVTR